MVRFSSSLEDKPTERREKQIPDNFELEYSRLAEDNLKGRYINRNRHATLKGSLR